ncbi:hypothetical protein [Erythrobacter sp. HKB08]|uniref:hypothetical protein n=1 Tax=Erythrobacter sp. HKB08 TaxID=2502843 RepID=UPI00100920B6|nr:hypothetical protein [Erythrobacter sp. HKB08]
MKTWHKVVLGIGAGIAVIALLVGAIFWATSGVTDAADEFFAAAGEGDYEAAHALTSKDLQRTLSAEGLQQYLERNGLDEVTDTSWSSRSIENDIGTVEGSVTTASGAKIPITLSLVKEGEDWRITFIERGRSGVGGDSGAPPLPTLEEQQSMIQSDTRQLATALMQDNPQIFLDRWLEQATAETLGQGFRDAQPLGQRMLVLANETPEMEDAYIDGRGLLTLAGTFENARDKARISFTYLRRNGEARIGAYEFDFDEKPRPDMTRPVE